MWQILTSQGYKNFLGMKKSTRDASLRIITNEKELSCTPEHPISTPYGFAQAQDLELGDKVHTKNGLEAVKKIEIQEGTKDFYDILGVENHEFIANGIVVHNCEFLGSANTLIDPAKIREFMIKNPKPHKIKNLRVYEEPVKESEDASIEAHNYLMLADIAEGKGLDYSAIQIIDISVMPYRQVAVYADRDLNHFLLPDVIKKIAEYYNNAFILIEQNSDGKIVSRAIWDDLEYENLLTVGKSNRGQELMGGRGMEFGLTMSAAVKKTGCKNIQTLIDNDQLVIVDADTITEMSKFVAHGTSYAASNGNDDLMMGLVIFGWCLTSDWFVDATKQNFVEMVRKKYEEVIEEEMPVEGFYFDGREENKKDGEWSIVS